MARSAAMRRVSNHEAGYGPPHPPQSALKASRKTSKLPGVCRYRCLFSGGRPANQAPRTVPARRGPAFQRNPIGSRARSWISPLTMAQGIRRLAMPIAAFLGAALVVMIASSWLLNREALRQAVEAQIRAVTGLDLVVKGATDISVFPGSYVSFHDVGLKGGGATDPALTVDVLTANLRLLPLLLQRFEIADVMMLRPRIRVVRDINGDSNWTPFISTITHTMGPGTDNQVSFSKTRIQTAG